MKRYLAIGVAVVLLLAFLIWRAQPQQVIKRRSKAVIEMLDQAAGGVGLFDVNRLEAMLANQIEIQLEVLSDEPQMVDAIQVLSAYQWMGDKVEQSNFEVKEFTDIRIDGDQAVVVMLVEGMVEMPDIRSLDGLHSCEFSWSRNGKGDWLLDAVVWVENVTQR